ncbi:manganese efflux pump MntP family protein [Paenibacillus melissococcoides]|uniref:Putative manganese efflux pump MntP n=1 Tax=Paenibacillus melissococcoides TaxID=2912268 RepID=A0ABN8UG47_9BACL|nr:MULTISPECIES: manganese efflux pump [Paenibacillus]MEB9893120.1 manganese efflux pump [Bacillus cereus]CAH8248697.1 manganese efflux pump MntP family protein [Paenibacillus melissococcoides]CAH8713998.1 manganese efflux pump MntP family protein [Paenibacillus melissococcoides]CAH8720234.1 manganese efflux pump MntP family protein [Paenibacillus melissococcoides]GIO80522.1 putative manganese efflux pump MntP [Paenibacillus dendritiformis]
MWETAVPAGQWITILVMAVALGFDAFSLCLGLGMRGVRSEEMLRISGIIALFHIAMPLLGVLTGHYISSILGHVAVMAAGGLLIMLGGHMMFSSFRSGSAGSLYEMPIWGTLLFALSVSIDSFSVGVSLGMFHTSLMVTIIAFGLAGGAMSVMGLVLGQRVGAAMGEYGEAVGGAILLTFGILFMLP